MGSRVGLRGVVHRAVEVGANDEGVWKTDFAERSESGSELQSVYQRGSVMCGGAAGCLCREITGVR